MADEKLFAFTRSLKKPLNEAFGGERKDRFIKLYKVPKLLNDLDS